MKKLLILTMFLFTLISINAQEPKDLPMIVTGIFHDNLEGSVFKVKFKAPTNTIVCILSLPEDQTEIGLRSTTDSFVYYMDHVEYISPWQVKIENGARVSSCILSLAGRHLSLNYSTKLNDLYLLFINDDGFYD